MQILILLVPVFFGFMGFAIDLGRMYLVRGELKSAANSMALAAAARLIGTDASVANASAAAKLAIADDAYSNNYDFGKVGIGRGNGFLSSVEPEPTFYETVSGATGEGGGGTEGGTTAARHVRVDITADAPLTFWGFLSVGQERKTPIAARAVAGVSSPLCSACNIEPLAIAPLNAEEPIHFGFTTEDVYTFHFQCTGTPQPSTLRDAPTRVPYVLLNRYNEEATGDYSAENSQLYRMGAGGMPPHTNPARSCISINAEEQIWATAVPAACSQNRVPESVTAFLCGLDSRFDTSLPAACEGLPDASTLISAYTPDTDPAPLESWSAYTGNLRRVITIPIVSELSATGTMTVLGFRQFVIQPNPDAPEGATLTPADNFGRFTARYIGSVVPLRSGTFGGCQVTGGPGKVVLHQ